MSHTPLPWQIEYQKIVDCEPSCGYNFNKVIAHPGHLDDWKDNAELIIRAVNSFSEQKELDYFHDTYCIKKICPIETILSKAKKHLEEKG